MEKMIDSEKLKKWIEENNYIPMFHGANIVISKEKILQKIKELEEKK